MVFKKQLNENGKYIDKQGVHFDVLCCERTESKEWYETGEYSEVASPNGGNVLVPIYASRIVINKGWDEYPSLEAALEAYGSAQ